MKISHDEHVAVYAAFTRSAIDQADALAADHPPVAHQEAVYRRATSMVPRQQQQQQRRTDPVWIAQQCRPQYS